jgi:DNA-binding NarL/FixJ family response regulator
VRSEDDATVAGAGRAIIRANPEPGSDPAGRTLDPAMSMHETQLVGRERELAAVSRALERLAGGQPGLVEVVGEPGIGKTRLLGELAADADRRGWLVLGGRATEFERDAPYGLWVDALDAHLQALDAARLRQLAGDELDALAVALPAFAESPAQSAERYVVHRAMRGLLGRLAAPRPLVLCLDDVHWADPASLDLVAALARRPSERGVLLAVAYREGQAPDALLAALGDAVRTARAERLALSPLSHADAARLCGGDAAPELYELSGGNPFYLEQLARTRSGRAVAADLGPGGAGIPAAVAAALAGELDALAGDARRVLHAAAVAGEPFEPELVAEIADLSEDVTLSALDALLEPALIRPTSAPRRFGFRHPLVRHAVYAAAPGAWRLHAHARAAAALERRGAGPVERAHHVEHAAQRGDRAAIELLADAAQRVFGQAPASAARYLESALRLLPDDADPTDRIKLLQTRAYALFGAGQLDTAHGVLADTLELLPRDAWEQRARLLISQTAIEAWSGRPVDEPLRRLRAALADEPGAPSLAGFGLRISIAGIALSDLQLDRVPELATEALEHARGVGHRRYEHAALAMLALGHAAAGHTDQARAALDRAIELLADIDDSELGEHSPGFWDLGWALTSVGRYEQALSQLRRAVAIDRRTGHDYFIPVLLASQLPALIQLGRLPEAVAVGEEAVEAGWASGTLGSSLGAHGELALARHLSGDTEGARRLAQDGLRLASAPRLWRARAGWTLGLIEADLEPAAGIATILQAAGGIELPDVIAADRPIVWAALAGAELQRADAAAAKQAAARLDAAAAHLGTPIARTLAARTRAAILLANGRPAEAATTAARAAAISSAPLEATRARALEGVALAHAGDRDRGIAALKQAADAFERFGAHRLRDQTTRELRRLGVRTWRRGPTAPRHTQGIQALSPREREVAALVQAGKRNTDIARELFLSLKTIESHTRNIYAKLGVSSRVELVTRLSEHDRQPFGRPVSTTSRNPGAE